MSPVAPAAKVERLALIDFSRGVAALMVVALHAADIVSQPKYFGVDPVGGMFACGARGVDYFFVLSGFIIAYVHWFDLGKPERLGAYAWKRIIRVYPTLWMVVIPFLAVCLLLNVDSMPRDWSGRWQVILGSLTLWPTRELPVPIVVWTLKHEILFYAAFALVLWRPRWGAVGLAMGGGVCLYHAAIGLAPNYLVDFLCNVYNLEFILGVGCGMFARRWNVPWPRTILAVGLVLFAAAAAQYHQIESSRPWITNPSTVWQAAQFGLSSALIVLGLAQIDRTYQPRVARSLAVLGAASYAIYLVHAPVMSFGIKICKLMSNYLPLPPPVVLCAMVLIGAAAGIVLHLGIERPLLQLFRNWPSTTIGIRFPNYGTSLKKLFTFVIE